MPTHGEVIYQAALAQVSGVGSRMIRELRTVFGTYQAAWEANPSEWLDVPGATPGLRDRFAEHRESFDMDGFTKRLADCGVFALLPDKIAIVGTRKASEHNAKQTRKVAYQLASLGLTVVSGMALGIDGAAHEGALEADGLTIAVLGSGVDVIYPPQHEALYRQLIEKGLVLSEFPPGTPPVRENFPKRNRIIAGLSHGVVVAEAGLSSGALITANFAIDAGREVFAFPGSAGSHSMAGCNLLIKNGQAKLIDDADDIVNEWPQRKSELLAQQLEKLKEQLELPMQASPNVEDVPAQAPVSAKQAKAPKPEKPKAAHDATPAPKPREEEVALLNHVSYERSHINDVARATGLSIAELAARLTLLELKGLVKSLPGGYYTRL
jgi:DNA processing protein